MPIDDADLLTKNVLSLFRDTMLLLGHPRILVVMVGDLQTFMYALQNEILDPANNLPSENLLNTPLSSLENFKNEHVNALLNKYLPKHWRVVLPNLSLRERLLFTPLTEKQTEKQTLLELFKQISVELAPKQSSDPSASVLQNTQDKITLAHYFDLSMRKYPEICRTKLSNILSVNTWIENPDMKPSLYAKMLPHKLRDIVHLYRALQQEISLENKIENRNRNANSTDQEFVPENTNQNKIIKTFWDHIAQSVEVVYQERLKNAVKWHHIENRGYRLELDYTGFSFGQQVGRGRRLTLNGKTHVGIRKCDFLFVNFPGPVDKSPDKTSRAKTEPSKQAQSAILFTSEFGDGGMKLSDGQTSKLGTPGGDAWYRTLNITYDGRDTDNRYWLIPAWDNYLDYNLYINAWNSLIDSILALDPSSFDDAQFVEKALLYVYLMHLQCVLDVHEHHTTLVPKLSGGLLIDFIRDKLDQVHSTWFTHITDRCVHVLSQYNEKHGDPRYIDFIDWFALLLPWSADTVIMSKQSCEKIIQLWRKGLDVLREKKSTRDYKKDALSVLTQRITSNINEPWAKSLINLLGKMGDKTGVRNMKMLMQRESHMSPKQALDAFTKQVDVLSNQVESEEARRLLRALSVLGPDIATLTKVGAHIPPQRYERLLTLARIASQQHAQKRPNTQTTPKQVANQKTLAKK